MSQRQREKHLGQVMDSYTKLLDSKTQVIKTLARTVPVKVMIIGDLRGGITTENFCGNFCPRGPQGCCTYTPTYNLFDLATIAAAGQEEFIRKVLLPKPLTVRKFYLQVNPQPETGICRFHDPTKGCTLDWVLRSRTCRRSACWHMKEILLSQIAFRSDSDNEKEFKLQREFKKFIKGKNPYFSLKDYLLPVNRAEPGKVDRLLAYLGECWEQFPLQEKAPCFQPSETHELLVETRVKALEEIRRYEEIEIAAVKAWP